MEKKISKLILNRLKDIRKVMEIKEKDKYFLMSEERQKLIEMHERLELLFTDLYSIII